MNGDFTNRIAGLAMRHIGRGLGVALMFASISIAGAAAFSYLAEAANEIDAIYHGSAALNSEDSARIAKIACDAMTRLTNDPQFKQSVQSFLDRRARQKDAAGAKELLVDLKKFSDVFIKAEQDRLQTEGVSLLTAIDTLSYAAWRRTRGDILDTDSVDPAEAIGKFKDAVCKLSESKAQHIEARPIVFGIFGVVMILADIGAEIETAGLSSASVALGGTMAYDAAKDLSR